MDLPHYQESGLLRVRGDLCEHMINVLFLEGLNVSSSAQKGCMFIDELSKTDALYKTHIISCEDDIEMKSLLKFSCSN